MLKNSKNFMLKKWVPATILSTMLFTVTACVAYKPVKDMSTKEFYNESIVKIYKNLDYDTQTDLHNSLSYLIAKHLHETNNSSIYKLGFLDSDQNIESYTLNLINEKNADDIIKLAKETAINDGIVELNNSSTSDFIYSYYSLATKEKNKVDVYKLYTTLSNMDTYRYSSFLGNPTNPNYITTAEFYEIQNKIIAKYIKKKNFKSLEDLQLTKQDKVQYNETFRTNKQLVQDVFYPPFDNKDKIKELENTIDYMKKSLVNNNYNNIMANPCSVDNISFKNFKIIDTAINESTFKTFDFNLTNHQTDMQDLRGQLILKDKENNYYMEVFSVRLNKPLEQNVSQDIKVVVNTNKYNPELLKNLSLYKMNFKYCINPNAPVFDDKLSLESNIEFKEDTLKKLKEIK